MPPAFRILGPLEATLDGRPASLGGPRERAILGILLLEAGEIVSVERLIQGVWGEARPLSAKHMVHEYVSRLRVTLGDDSTIATRPPGYLLELPAALDADAFAALVAAGREAARDGQQADALRQYDEALALWRGDALSDVVLDGHAQVSATRLDQERLLVAEERVDCALALGRHGQLIPELEHRLEEAPLRERTRGQLMLALYRAGRQTEALDRYREGRALLVEHAGVEPGPELRGLERAILTQDPALDLPAPLARPARAITGARKARSRRIILIAALAVLAAAIGVLVLVALRSGSDGTQTRVEADSAGAIDPGRNRFVADVPVEAGPGRLAVGFGSLWVVNDYNDTLSRIDLATHAVERVPTCNGPTAIATGARLVWVACTGTRSVDEINPDNEQRVGRVPLGSGPSAIAFSPGRVWVADRLDDTVAEIDASSGRTLETVYAGAGPADLVYAFGSLWIADESSAEVARLDPRTRVITEIPVGNGPEAIEAGFGSIWVANSLDGTVSRIDPSRNVETSTVHVGTSPSSVLASDGSIWVADSYANRIARIDPGTNAVVRTIEVDSAPQSLVAGAGKIWVSARQPATSHRGGTLRLFNRGLPDSLDTGVAYAAEAWSVLADTGDGLVGFKRVDGPDGASLVADLATSIPRPSDDGRTYSFQLRRGVRYSNGEPVRASDFRRALERYFRLGAVGGATFEELLGAPACSRERCDLRHGVETDDVAGTVTLHLRHANSDLLDELALPFADPVPRGTPITRTLRLGAPGTGPYVIASYAMTRPGSRRLVLERNPYFREWSAAAQPDGYADRIVWTYNANLDAQLTAVEQGRADFMQSPLPPSRRADLMTRDAAQVHLFPYSATFGIFLNTRVPPFDNLKARQAVNFAIDRARAATGIDDAHGQTGFGGVAAAAVTCQIVPAGMAGYRPYCPYTRDRTVRNVWLGPDLARARRLIAESGTRGERVTFWTGPMPIQRLFGTLAAATLRQLGYRVTLKRFSDDQRFFDMVHDSRVRAQAGFYAWSQDYPAPSNFLEPLFACASFRPASVDNLNPAEICDPRIEKAIDRARARQATAGSANPEWAQADRVVTDLAPFVPLANTRIVAVVSRRVHNVQRNAQWGVLVDQMWVR